MPASFCAPEEDAPSILQVAQEIDERIAKGLLAPGQRLIEKDLMAELGVSRGAVREALRFLAGDGVVELLPNRGVRVKVLTASWLASMFDVLAGIFRTGMELFAAREIKDDARNAVLAAIDRIQVAVATGSSLLMIERIVDFHETVSNHCGNEYLPSLLKRIHLRHYSRQQAQLADPDAVRSACADYPEIARRLLEGDADGSYAVLKPHLTHMTKALKSKTATA